MLDDVSEASSVPISTIADTWIHLSYVIHAGERNRSLSIVKSRGTWHSNQVRELVLHEDGVTLTDAYSAGGEVLMGTLRWEKERAEEIMREEREATSQQKRAKLELDGVELEIRLKSIQRKLAAKKDELALMERQEAMRQEKIQIDQSRLRAIRGSDEKGAK
jgi:circadian clock protein KaiC